MKVQRTADRSNIVPNVSTVPEVPTVYPKDRSVSSLQEPSPDKSAGRTRISTENFFDGSGE